MVAAMTRKCPVISLDRTATPTRTEGRDAKSTDAGEHSVKERGTAWRPGGLELLLDPGAPPGPSLLKGCWLTQCVLLWDLLLCFSFNVKSVLR